MFTFDQVVAQFGLLKDAFGKAAEDSSKYIADLKAQVASGVPVTQDQLDALGSNMTDLTAAVTQFDVTNSEPVVIPAPLPIV